jgi:hypothetical protein
VRARFDSRKFFDVYDESFGGYEKAVALRDAEFPEWDDLDGEISETDRIIARSYIRWILPIAKMVELGKTARLDWPSSSFFPSVAHLNGCLAV